MQGVDCGSEVVGIEEFVDAGPVVIAILYKPNVANVRSKLIHCRPDPLLLGFKLFCVLCHVVLMMLGMPTSWVFRGPQLKLLLVVMNYAGLSKTGPLGTFP